MVPQHDFLDSGIDPRTSFFRRWDWSQTLIGTSHFNLRGEKRPCYWVLSLITFSSEILVWLKPPFRRYNDTIVSVYYGDVFDIKPADVYDYETYGKASKTTEHVNPMNWKKGYPENMYIRSCHKITMSPN